MTMLELAERLGNAGFSRLLRACRRSRPGGGRLADDPLVADRLAAFETEVTGLRALCRRIVERHGAHEDSPADASVVKLFYSELLQRMTDFGTEIGGLPAHSELQKPASSSWESGAWVLDFIGSWEWTIPGGTSEIQRTIIGERGLGMPREPAAGS
jgi:alkylation response protein AidB-like acyl-CoA dehydrogenase